MTRVSDLGLWPGSLFWVSDRANGLQCVGARARVCCSNVILGGIHSQPITRDRLNTFTSCVFGPGFSVSQTHNAACLLTPPAPPSRGSTRTLSGPHPVFCRELLRGVNIQRECSDCPAADV